MTRIYFFMLLMACYVVNLQAQQWVLSGNVPSAYRYDDIYFINPMIGWAVNSNGVIYKTFDGGHDWGNIHDGESYLRSVEFIDEEVGFAGPLDNTFLRTTNGGITWDTIQQRIPHPIKGICGLSHSGDHVFGVGVWTDPAYFIKSIDRGETWTFTDMSAYADALVDCYFLNENIGFASGKREQHGAVILKTEDGGNSWTQVFETGISYGYVWKLDFLNDQLGYGSIEFFSGNATKIVKTIDGGNTWVEKLVDTLGGLDIQGIGFVDENNGWVSPRYTSMYETHDGGETWQTSFAIQNINRIFRLDSANLFAAGSRLYKYDATTAIPYDEKPATRFHQMLSVTPNPITHEFVVEVKSRVATFARLDMMSADGLHAINLFSGHIGSGDLHWTFSEDKTRGLSSGLYVLVLRTHEELDTYKVIFASN